MLIKWLSLFHMSTHNKQICQDVKKYQCLTITSLYVGDNVNGTYWPMGSTNVDFSFSGVQGLSINLWHRINF
jgi:hypothetical protein